MKYLANLIVVLTICTTAFVSPSKADPSPVTSAAQDLDKLPLLAPEHGYFVESPLPFRIQGVFFGLTQISGDGEVLLGWVGDGFETWSARAGIRPVAAFPKGYGPDLKSLNRDGSVATGIFVQNLQGSIRITDYGLFRWPLSGHPELLSPHFLPPDSDDGLVGEVDISSDGNKIWFFCKNASATGQCPIAAASPKVWVAEIWSREKGFTLANADLPSRFNYATPLGNGTTSLAGVIGTDDFGLVGADGRFTALAGFPMDFDPQSDKFITNRPVTVIALERSTGSPRWWLWNAQGAPLPMPMAPVPCPHFPVRIGEIDDSGAIFASAFCPALAGESEDIGLRISSTGMQTLGDWLRSRGVPNDLPASAGVMLVSDDGRTVYGQTASPPAIGGTASAASPRLGCPNTVCQFLAHVP